MQKSNSYIGHILALLVMIIYGFNTNFMKSLIPIHIGAFGLVFARCIISTFTFWFISLFVKEKADNHPPLADKIKIMIAGALGIGINSLLYVKGLELSGPIDATVIRTLQPIMIIAITVMFFHAKVNHNKIIGIILGLIGTIYISVTPYNKSVDDSFYGNILIFMAAISVAIYLVVIKPYVAKYKSITIMKWLLLPSIFITMPFGFTELLTAPIFHEPFAIGAWSKLGFTLFFASIVAYLLSILALKYISVFVQSTYIYILPIATTLVAIVMKIQYPNWHDPIALGFILAGFIFINKKIKVKKP